MKFIIDGTKDQTDTIDATATALRDMLGTRIKDDVNVIFKPDDKMKKRADGGTAYGFWSSKPRVISLWGDIGEYNVVKTFIHEVMHVLDTDWLTPDQRSEILKLMVPKPDDWRDQRIDGQKMKYVSDPSEVFAVYASAAVGDLEKPAYTGMYKRRIDKAEWGGLKSIIMRDKDTGDRGKNDDDEVGVPPDSSEDLQEQLDDTKKKVNEFKTQFQTSQNELTDAKKALDTARAEAKEARDQLAPTQTQLADVKTKLNAAQNELTDARNALEGARAEAKEARDQLAPTQTQLTEARSKLNAVQNDLTNARNALEGARAEAKEARDQLAPTQTQLADAKSQLTAAQTDLATAQNQLTTVQAQLTTAQNEASQAAAQIAAAVAAKDAAEQGRAQAGMKLAQAKQNASDIRTALTAGDTATATAKATEIAAL